MIMLINEKLQLRNFSLHFNDTVLDLTLVGLIGDECNLLDASIFQLSAGALAIKVSQLITGWLGAAKTGLIVDWSRVKKQSRHAMWLLWIWLGKWVMRWKTLLAYLSHTTFWRHLIK